jgi:hypothetical protein
MAISVKKITLWRREVEDRPGTLAQTLQPLAEAGANLQVLMSYAMGSGKAAIEVFPVAGKKAVAAAQQGGLAASGPPALLVQGDNRAGLGHALARGLADEGINIHFLVAQVIGGRYSSVVGFGSDEEATRAIAIIKKAGAGRPAGRGRSSGGTRRRSGRRAGRR